MFPRALCGCGGCGLQQLPSTTAPAQPAKQIEIPDKNKFRHPSKFPVRRLWTVGTPRSKTIRRATTDANPACQISANLATSHNSFGNPARDSASPSPSTLTRHASLWWQTTIPPETWSVPSPPTSSPRSNHRKTPHTIFVTKKLCYFLYKNVLGCASNKPYMTQ